MSTSDPPTTAPLESSPPAPSVQVAAPAETDFDPKVAAAKALLKKNPPLVAMGSLDSDATSPESPAPPADKREPAAAAAAVTAPALVAEDSVAEPLASAVATGEHVGGVQEKPNASDDSQELPSIAAGEFGGGRHCGYCFVLFPFALFPWAIRKSFSVVTGFLSSWGVSKGPGVRIDRKLPENPHVSTARIART